MNNSNLATDAQSARPALPAAKDKLLFTPGPLTTSPSVKQAMLHDAGSWHFEFNALVADVRERLLQLAGVARATGWEVVPRLAGLCAHLPPSFFFTVLTAQSWDQSCTSEPAYP